MKPWLILGLCLSLLAGCGQRPQQTQQVLHVAVASNFLPTLKALAEAYNQDKEQPLKIQTMAGSTGLLYAQIEVGAPFDLFFAADLERPAKLVEAGKTIGPPRIYALGRLVLWAPVATFQSPRERLLEQEYKHLVIANPNVAPYGMAAREVLIRLGQWDAVIPRLIRGDNIAQAYQYLDAGRAELGFVALAQIRHDPAVMRAESLWEIPAKMHKPLQQAAVLLPGEKLLQAKAFLDFCLSQEGRAIIKSAGYDLPQTD